MISKRAQFVQQIAEALAVLGPRRAEEELQLLEPLAALSFPDLLKATAGNPLSHHPTVLGHMTEIAAESSFAEADVRRGAAVSLLHDISAVPKITKHMVDRLRVSDTEAAAALELRRREARLLHMREGSALAHRRLLDVNEWLGRVAYDASDITEICELIRIHDSPSIDLPIARRNWLAVSFREADRLWMLTEEGLKVDLERAGKSVEDAGNWIEQAEHNVQRFRDERSLYRAMEPAEGPFCDADTFFRNPAGHAIYLRLYARARDAYGLPTGATDRRSGGTSRAA